VRDLPSEELRKLPPAESYIKLSFSPQDLRDQQLKTNELSELTTTDLARRIDLAKRAGKETARDEVDYYAKYAMAFTSLIVVLFGVPFASQKKRGGLALEFAVAIGIAFFYLAFTKVSFTFGYSGAIHPILTAWMANVIFIVIAIFVMARVQK
jgi:lipopolysaccharide export system permease protein